MKKSNIYTFALFVIFTFNLINNFIILKQDNVPLFFDEGGFYNLSVNYYRYLFSSSNFSKIFYHFHSISNFYPPLVFIMRIPFFMVWGVSQDISVFANILFLFILIYFTFLIGRYIGDAKVGLLAAFLVAFYPAVYGFSRTNFVTTPIAAVVAMSLYFLLRTEYFTRRKYSILLGFSIGLGLLIKWIYAIYVFPSILVCIFKSYQKRKDFSNTVINLLLSITVGILIALIWYLPNIKHLIPMLFSANYDNPNWLNFISYLRENPFRLGLFNYAMVAERYQLHTFYSLLFIFFLVRYLFSKNNNLRWFFSTSLIVPYLIFSFAVVEYYSGELCPRYIVPLYNLFAVITTKGVVEIKRKFLKRILVILIILFGFVQFYWLSYSNVDKNIYTKEDFQKRTTSGLLSPKTVEWKLNDIINTIRNNRISNKPNILIIPHTPLTSALAYKLQLRDDSNLMFPLNATFVDKDYTILPVEKYKELIEKADFVLTKESGKFTYNDSPWIKEGIETIIDLFEQRKKEFTLLSELSVDIDEVETRFLIYKRNRPEGGLINISEPEGEGILIQAVDFARGNLAYSEKYGLLIDGGVSPAYVAYEINLLYDGNYELWVRYATRQDETKKLRPVDIYFDNVLKKAEALTNITKGWDYFDSQWFKEVDIEAKKGRHSLKFIAPKTPFPHLDSIKIIYKPK